MQTTLTGHYNRGLVARLHNKRDEKVCAKEQHIDYHNDMGQSWHEAWLTTMDTKSVYEDLFNDAIDAYNAKQTRKDRQMSIDDYMQTIKNDNRGKKQTTRGNDGKRIVDKDAVRQGKQLTYELVFTIGNSYARTDEQGRTIYTDDKHIIKDEELPRDLSRTILHDFYIDFENNYSNLKIVNADFHADEFFTNGMGQKEYSAPHLHIEFIPFADGFKAGLQRQNSMNKAMKAMGYEGNDCYNTCREDMEARLEAITQKRYKDYCDEHPDYYVEHGDLTIHHPVKERIQQGNRTKEQLRDEQLLKELLANTKVFEASANKRYKELTAMLTDVNNQKEYLDDREKRINAKEAMLNRTQQELLCWQQRLERKQDLLNHKENRLNEQEEYLNDKEQGLRARADALTEKYNQLKTAEDKLHEDSKNEAVRLAKLQDDIDYNYRNEVERACDETNEEYYTEYQEVISKLNEYADKLGNMLDRKEYNQMMNSAPSIASAMQAYEKKIAVVKSKSASGLDIGDSRSALSLSSGGKGLGE